ncbi:MAG: M12 family metallo-peptidase [Cytophagales bacterium]|nr:M12 family metallo-peptidase [Cytophagales bacterium]
MRLTFIYFFVLLAFGVQSQNTWQAPHSSQRLADDQWKDMETIRMGLNDQALVEALAVSGKAVQPMQFPMPDGTFRSFSMQEASILAPGLQAKFPEIRTYKGTNELGETIRIDVNPKGFHGIMFTREGTVYIDPETSGSNDYVSYYRQEFKNKREAPAFDEALIEKPATPLRKVQRSAQMKTNYGRSSGTELKSYRIAIAASNDYTEFHGGSVSDALAAIVTTMNRVTGIYESELAVTFVIIDNNDELIFTNASSDPYADLDGDGAIIQENQEVLDRIIGSANYDIGHIFKTGSSGLAGLGVVCNANRKGQGVTGLDSPQGDPFDVDFVAHEIGHQFGGNHTFNGSAGSCSGANRNPSTAYEPGSGSTIMAYAGICFAHNIQNNSDAFFHAVSLEEILTYTTDFEGGNCPTVTATGNTPPEVSAPEGGFTIPIGTPFSLTASGSDADGDAITYSWEQYDLGDAGSPDLPGRTSPLFRSFSPTTSPTRYFPRLGDLLNNTTVFGEILPANSREMNFRVTVRDNNSAGGGTNEANVQFNTTDQAGPFRVTSQNASVTYPGGSSQLIEWDVANTDKAPISLENVQILLSTDGGATFSEVLSESTANDGAEFVLMPNENIADARIMVAAVGNVFFNVNQSSFEIQQDSEPGFSFLVSEVPGITCNNTIDFTVEAVAVNGFSEAINLTFATDNTGLTVSASQTSLSPGESITLTIENSEEIGEKSITLRGTAGDIQSESAFSFSFLSIPAERPGEILPLNQESGVDLDVDFSWSEVTGATSYNFTLATDEIFTDILVESLGQVATSFSLSEDLISSTTYHWKVAGVNECGIGPEAEQTFTTAFVQEVDLAASDLPLDITDFNTTTSVIEVTQNVSVGEVKVEGLDITHTFVGDMTIILTSPAGTAVTLFREQCGSAGDILISFDDGADEATACPPNDDGTYQPLEALSAFENEDAMGNWTLSVADNGPGDQGSINAWNLVLVVGTEAIALTAATESADQVDIAWNDISIDEGYEIEQALGDDDFQKVSEVAANVTSATFTGLESSTEYRYRVRAILPAGFSEYSNIAQVVTLPDPPEAPSNLEGSFDSEGRILLSWTDNSDVEEGFTLDRAAGNGEFTELASLVANITSFRDDNTERGVDYAYRVSAFNVSGTSDPSNEITVLVLSSERLDPSMIYPNPTAEAITVSASVAQNFERLTIYDLKGSILIRSSLNQNESISIDLSRLDPGLYFVQLADANDNKQVLKIVKTR